MKKEKDLIAARYLNAHIMAPSNCFDLIDVPSVSQIICGNDLPSRMIARQLAEVIRKQTFVYPVIYSGPEFALLDMAKTWTVRLKTLFPFCAREALTWRKRLLWPGWICF